MRRNGFVAIAFGALATLLISNVAHAEEIRVRVRKLPYSFEVQGERIEIIKSKNNFQRARFLNLESMKVSFDPRRMAWSVQTQNQGLTRYQEIRGEALALRASRLYIDKDPVPSELLLFADPIYKRVDAVAAMDIEQYLHGVLPSEMPASWPLEALKAQAVASRTYALYKKSKKPEARFHVVSSILDQVFNYKIYKELPGQHLSSVQRALLETRGMTLESASGKPLQAFYHAACGGRTEPAQKIWKTAAKIPSVSDPYCRTGKHANWKRSISFDEVRRKLKVNSEVSKVEVVSHTESGRVGRLKIRKSDGSSSSMSANLFRKKLGYSRLKSTFFSIHNRDSGLEVRGRGFGHGAGLCQWGARGLSLKGKGFEAILAHYYPNAKISRPAQSSVASL